MLINCLKISLDFDKMYIILCSFMRQFSDLLAWANLNFCNLKWISVNALEFYSHLQKITALFSPLLEPV